MRKIRSKIQIDIKYYAQKIKSMIFILILISKLNSYSYLSLQTWNKTVSTLNTSWSSVLAQVRLKSKSLAPTGEAQTNHSPPMDLLMLFEAFVDRG